MKLFIISDIHGSLSAFEKALTQFDKEAADFLVICGDYLNHGPRNNIPEGYDTKKLAEKFLKKKAKIQNLQLREWEPGPAQILKQDLPEGFIGWISDGDIKNYHHEILVDMQHGYICAFLFYF